MDDCILWTGAKNSKGYGHRLVKHRWTYVHRLAFEMAYGPIPEGLEIDHLCRVRNCINPTHLEAVTHAENCRRTIGDSRPAAGQRQRAKTHCPHGHPYAGANLIVRTHSDGSTQRFCRECRDRNNARQIAARKSLTKPASE